MLNTNDANMKDNYMDDLKSEMMAIAKEVGFDVENAGMLKYINIVYRRSRSRYTFGRGKFVDKHFIDAKMYSRMYGVDIDDKYDKSQYVYNHDYTIYHNLDNKVNLDHVNE